MKRTCFFLFVILNRDDASLPPPKLGKGLKILEKNLLGRARKLILTAEGCLYYGGRGGGVILLEGDGKLHNAI